MLNMHKSKAFELLGNNVKAVAEAVGVSSSAVSQWPDELPDRIADRVLAALARKHLPPEMIGGEPAAVTGDGTGQALLPIPAAAYPADAQPLETGHAA